MMETCYEVGRRGLSSSKLHYICGLELAEAGSKSLIAVDRMEATWASQEAATICNIVSRGVVEGDIPSTKFVIIIYIPFDPYMQRSHNLVSNN